jgi:hypothetical protein
VNGTTTLYVSDGDREELEYDGSTGAVLRRYTYGAGIDEALDLISAAGDRTILVPDIQGSIVGTIDGAGTITKAGLRPYGESADTTGSFRRPFSLDGMYLLCSLGRTLFDIVNQHVATTGCGGPEPLPRAPVFVLIFLAGATRRETEKSL